MGTSYYLHETKCKHCGHAPEPLHIGKSSDGWCFALHSIPEKGLIDLDSWFKHFSTPELTIRDEYGKSLAPIEMLEIIVSRVGRWVKHDSGFLLENNAEDGPTGLLRHKIGRYCVAHGSGTWDMIPGEFS